MGVRNTEFQGAGGRKQLANEKALQAVIAQWSKKYLMRLTNQFLRSRKSGQVAKAAASYVGTKAELMRILRDWYVKGYNSQLRTTAHVTEDPAKILRQATFDADARAQAELTKLKRSFYDSTREHMAKLHRFQQRHDLPPPTEAFIRRQLLGLPGPSPHQWAGAPTPPTYRFRGRKLRTHGTDGVDGSRDPYSLAARARMIARTELTQARNAAAEQGLEVLGAEFKMWQSFDDTRTRRSHKHIDGAVVKIGQPFKWKSKQPGIYGETVSAMAPGALSLPAAERINCRCFVTMATADEYRDWQKSHPGKVIKNV